MPCVVETQTMLSALAGLPATTGMLIDVSKLAHEYFKPVPDLDDPYQMVSFSSGGHRGSPLHGSFTETHILALTQAVCDFRRRVQGTTGPLYLGKDTHTLSGPAERTALTNTGTRHPGAKIALREDHAGCRQEIATCGPTDSREADACPGK